MLAIIHYARVGKDLDIYTEGLVLDNGIRLDTRTVVPQEFAVRWSGRLTANGMLQPGDLVYALQKHHFYTEWFGIIELLDAQERVLGYYCDILTPLRKEGDIYHLFDLLLDLWVYPDRTFLELDWDEFNSAVAEHRLAEDLAKQAASTLKRLVAETRAGTFPDAYISDKGFHV